MISQDKQTEYNNWFIAQIKKHCEEWERYIKKEEYENIQYLSLDIPAPESKSDGITISCYGTELTLFFKKFHCHYDQFKDDDHEQEFLHCFNDTKEIIKENLIIISSYEKNKLISSQMIGINEKIPTRKGIKTVVESWQGNYDKEINA